MFTPPSSVLPIAAPLSYYPLSRQNSDHSCKTMSSVLGYWCVSSRDNEKPTIRGSVSHRSHRISLIVYSHCITVERKPNTWYVVRVTRLFVMIKTRLAYTVITFQSYNTLILTLPSHNEPQRIVYTLHLKATIY